MGRERRASSTSSAAGGVAVSDGRDVPANPDDGNEDSDWSANSSSASAASSAYEDSDDGDDAPAAPRATTTDHTEARRREASDAVLPRLPLRPSDDAHISTRARRSRNGYAGASTTGTESSGAIAAYAEALRTTASHRESISTGAAGGTHFLLPEETRRRHRDSKRRVEVSERTQLLLIKAHELSAVADDVPLWLHAHVVPPRWRQQLAAHVAPVHMQMTFCQQRVLGAWRLLLPPFDRANFIEFEARVAQFERATSLLDAVLVQCQQLVEAAERTAACGFIQLWYRKQLARRGFYTRTVCIGRRERGLVPGLFDSTAGQSKLTLDRRTRQATLEYPTSPNTPPAFR